MDSFKLSQEKIENADTNIEQWLPFIKRESKIGGAVDEDLFQTLLLGVLEDKHKYDDEKAAFSTWLWYKVKNIKSNLSTKNSRRIDTANVDINDLYHLSTNCDVENEHIEKDIKKEMDSMLDLIKPFHRKLLKLRFYDQKTLKEIGQEFDCSKQYIMQVEKKALEKLRSLMRWKGNDKELMFY